MKFPHPEVSLIKLKKKEFFHAIELFVKAKRRMNIHEARAMLS